MTNSVNTNSDPLVDKLRDINVPGFVARLTPDEADEIFFEETAIPDDDVPVNVADLVDDED